VNFAFVLALYRRGTESVEYGVGSKGLELFLTGLEEKGFEVGSRRVHLPIERGKMLVV
jgi:hypothetical protein